MSDTLTSPALVKGTRVAILAMPGSSQIGKYGTLTGEVYDHIGGNPRPYAIVDDSPGPHDDGSWVISEWVTLPSVGDKVRAISVPAISAYDGAVCTVTSVEYNFAARVATIRGEFQSKQNPEDTESWVFSEWEPVASNEAGEALATDIVEPRMIPVADHDRTVESLQAVNRRLEQSVSDWRHDFEAYAGRVLEEAVDRDWCSEYERVMSDVEAMLRVATLPQRDEERDFYWEETYVVTVRRYGSGTFPVGADDDVLDSEAREQNSNGDATREEIIEAVRRGDYECDSYVDGSARWH